LVFYTCSLYENISNIRLRLVYTAKLSS